MRSFYFKVFFVVSITLLPRNPPICFLQGDGNPVISKADAELPAPPSILKLFSPKSHLDDKKRILPWINLQHFCSHKMEPDIYTRVLSASSEFCGIQYPPPKKKTKKWWEEQSWDRPRKTSSSLYQAGIRRETLGPVVGDIFGSTRDSLRSPVSSVKTQWRSSMDVFPTDCLTEN